jgi:hypothetical protein
MSSGNWIVTRMTSIGPPNFGSGEEVQATQDGAQRRVEGVTPLLPRNSESGRGDWIPTAFAEAPAGRPTTPARKAFRKERNDKNEKTENNEEQRGWLPSA